MPAAGYTKSAQSTTYTKAGLLREQGWPAAAPSNSTRQTRAQVPWSAQATRRVTCCNQRAGKWQLGCTRHRQLGLQHLGRQWQGGDKSASTGELTQGSCTRPLAPGEAAVMPRTFQPPATPPTSTASTRHTAGQQAGQQITAQDRRQNQAASESRRMSAANRENGGAPQASAS